MNIKIYCIYLLCTKIYSCMQNEYAIEIRSMQASNNAF